MKSHHLSINYSIKNIIQCILEDNPKSHEYTLAQKRSLFKERSEFLHKHPKLEKILSVSHIHRYPIKGTHHFARISILPPELIVIDQRIKDMCTLPFWTTGKDKNGKPYRWFGKCPGYNYLPGCPPNSPSVKKTQEMLNHSDLFIVLQTRLISERGIVRWHFLVLHKLAHEIEKIFGTGSVIEKFGSGPCTACNTQPCLRGKPCRNPSLKTFSLESMGICVESICSDLCLLTGQRAWKLKWLKHFGYPQQSPMQWKYVEALAIKLPRNKR